MRMLNRPCSRRKRGTYCADTMGPWGEMRLGPTRKVLDWCHTARRWCYAGQWGEHCVIPLDWSVHLCSPLDAWPAPGSFMGVWCEERRVVVGCSRDCADAGCVA